jgi:hypothetical protein
MGSICEIHEIVDAVLYLEGAGDEYVLVSFEPILVNFESSDLVVQSRRWHI